MTLLLALAAVPAHADWSSLRSDHFHVVGRVSARELREVALRLEQFREVTLKLLPGAVDAAGSAPVIVVVFPDDRAFEPFMPRVNGRRVPVSGLFTGGPNGSYIALSMAAGDAAFPVVYHEYSHALLAGTFGGAPLWFTEGLAEYYSTFEITAGGRRALVGKPIERHVARLRGRRLPMAALLSIRANSPEYTRDTPDREVLYAQGWAVVHHALHGTPNRRRQLVELTRTLAAGSSPEQSVRNAYGMSLTELEREVQAYVRRETYQYTSFEFTDAISTSVDADVTRADDADADAWLGGLLANLGRVDEAATRLERALQARPELGTTHLALATVRLRQGRGAEAREHLDRARELGAERPLTFSIRLGDRDSRLFLGNLARSAGDYARIPELLAPLVAAEPDNHDAALILADALIRLDDLTAARALLGPIVARGATEPHRAQARSLLATLASRPASPERSGNVVEEPRDAAPAPATAPGETPSVSDPVVRPVLRVVRDGEQQSYGVFQTIDCRQNGVILVVRAADAVIRAHAASLSAVEFVTYRTSVGGQISCGAQPDQPAVLTWRARTGDLPVAIALELLPDGFVPPSSR